MSGTVQESRVFLLLGAAEQILRELQTLDLTSCGDGEVVAAVQANERVRRMLEPVDHALILEVEQRGIPARALSGGRVAGCVMW